MKFVKGQEVIALDIDRKPHRMKVWSVSEKTVFVATSNLFEAIESGKSHVWPVGVPKSDVKAASRVHYAGHQ